MSNQLKPTQARIVLLAERERGDRTREQQFGGESGISFNTYANFAAGKSWPRARNRRRIEAVLGWPSGIIDEVESSEMDPADIRIEHMRGDLPLSTRAGLGDYSDADLLDELRRRAGARGDYDLAASDDLGGVGPSDEEDH